ncbi:MAG: EamA family transporter [Coriobacteriia bacterium]
MLTALLASTGAALFGSADFLGGSASRKSPALAVCAAMYLVGVVLLALLLLVVRPREVSAIDFAWGVSSGVFGMVGVLALYAALATGRMSVVAPLTAGLAGAGPAAFDLLRGTRIGVSSLIGIGLALVAVVVVSTTKGAVEEHGMPTKAIVLSVLSGTTLGCSLVSLSLTVPASGFAPLLVARIVGLAIMGVALFARSKSVSWDAGSMRLAALAGTLDAGANIAILSAIRIGPLAVASVVGGLYPVVTMLLARMFLGERLQRHQAFGVAIALAAVVLTALP